MTQVQELAPRTQVGAALMEKVVVEGDLSVLSPGERVQYYAKVCESLGLNPLTKPFDYLKLNNKLTLYARRDATDQLRQRNGISIVITGRETLGDVYVVTAKATTKEGRTDESTGVVTTKGLAGDFLANAYMKAETKAKRRVTLSIVGLGWMDETEIETVKGAAIVEVDPATGEIKSESTPAKPAPRAAPKGQEARTSAERPAADAPVKDYGELCLWAFKRHGLQPKDMLGKLGISDKSQVSTYSEAQKQIEAVMNPEGESKAT